MIKFCSFLFLCYFSAANQVGAKPPVFIDGLEDVPLMDGLKQKNAETFSFGNEESRLIEVYLTSPKAGFKRIEKFYRESLPQLGWNYQGTDDNSVIFYRDGESLSIHKESINPLTIRITVKNRS